MKKHMSTVFLVLIIVIGLSLLLYPTFSDWWNASHQSRVIDNYSESVAELDTVTYVRVWEEARAYNQTLVGMENRWFLTDEQTQVYHSMMNAAGNGIMGYIEIPELSVRLPIYHGVEESVLQVGVGHIPGSSLPTGGAGTHCVLSGHRGLPSAKLFTSLDKMAEGDLFMLHVLDETLTYEVDQILTVLPEEVEALEIDPEGDYCTLVTCTPYGVNTHRLLVRGRRVENIEEKAPVCVTADAMQINEWLVAPFAATLTLALFGLFKAVLPKKRKRR